MKEDLAKKESIETYRIKAFNVIIDTTQKPRILALNIIQNFTQIFLVCIQIILIVRRVAR